MIKVNKITVVPSHVTLYKGKMETYEFLGAAVEPSNATCKCVCWVSSDPRIVAVNETTGYIYAKKAGTARIFAIACDGSGVNDYCTVTVEDPVYVESIEVYPTELELEVGETFTPLAEISPNNATNKCVHWSSNRMSVATVDDLTGKITAISPGTALVSATACDISGVHASIAVTVTPVSPSPTKIKLELLNTSLKVGQKATATATVIFDDNSTDKSVRWSSSNTYVANVDPYSGEILAQNPGIATITAATADGSLSASRDVWVRGKTPVFLIHGRTSNSFDTWGAGNRIRTDPKDNDNKDNNHFDSSLTAYSTGSVSSQYQYTQKSTQEICGYASGLPMIVDGVEVENFWVPGVFNGKFEDGEYTSEHPEGGNLAFYLKQQGYKENVNLFVFNYPNEDAVVHSAKKFEAYINNLLEYVRTSGSDEMKACFYRSRSEYLAENHKINIVGHSMGGLVARYYIENIGEGYHVNKLITICTPHWGSGYADLSNLTGNVFGIKIHVLADHDLDFDSAMYGFTNSTTISCNKGTCPKSNYTVTPALQYQRQRATKYYAIAGIDYDAAYVNLNDHTFEMPTDFTTSQEIANYLVSKNVYKLTGKDSQIISKPNPKSIGDNMVGFLSQIGWIGDNNNVNTPKPKIQMHKIFVDVDTSGGNGGETFFWEVAIGSGQNILHSKINHRQPVCDKVLEYLEG